MEVKVNERASSMIYYWNKGARDNIEGIFNIISKDMVFLNDCQNVLIDGGEHRKIRIIDLDSRNIASLKFEQKDDIFNDCFIIENDREFYKYEFNMDKSNDYFLRLVEVQNKINKYMVVGVSFYNYGTVIRVNMANVCILLEIQGKNVSVDYRKLISMVRDSNSIINMNNLNKIVNESYLAGKADKVIISNYVDDNLTNKKVIVNDKTICARVLKRKKEKSL